MPSLGRAFRMLEGFGVLAVYTLDGSRVVECETFDCLKQYAKMSISSGAITSII